MIKILVNHNALHRSNFKLLDLSLEDILEHIQQELNELKDSRSEYNGRVYYSTLEVADLINCLLHFVMRDGITLEQLESQCIYKLMLRFSIAEDPKPADPQ